MVVSIDKESSSLFSFQPPSLTLHLALGHKRGAWYLLFARPYAMADSREVSRLDQPGRRLHDHGELGEAEGLLRFWFDPSAFSGWERNDQSLLDYLLSLDPQQPAILSLASGSYKDDEDLQNPKEVVVLVPEHRLARWCEQCGRWESMNDKTRFVLVRQGELPGYLCPACHQKDWWARRTLRSIEAFFDKISYLPYGLCR